MACCLYANCVLCHSFLHTSMSEFLDIRKTTVRPRMRLLGENLRLAVWLLDNATVGIGGGKVAGK